MQCREDDVKFVENVYRIKFISGHRMNLLCQSIETSHSRGDQQKLLRD